MDRKGSRGISTGAGRWRGQVQDMIRRWDEKNRDREGRIGVVGMRVVERMGDVEWQ